MMPLVKAKKRNEGIRLTGIWYAPENLCRLKRHAKTGVLRFTGRKDPYAQAEGSVYFLQKPSEIMRPTRDPAVSRPT